MHQQIVQTILPSRLYHNLRYLKNSLEIKLTNGKKLPRQNLKLASARKFDPLFKNSFKNFKSIVLPYKTEFKFPLGFVYNGQFEAVDFEIYWSMIRKFKPNLIIEIGSGHSTQLAVKALKKNRKGKIVVVDPAPQRNLPKEAEHQKSKVENVDPKIYKRLTINDILFIDSSHTAGEAKYHVEKILPNLKKGVLIHHHDIYYPYKAKFGEEKVVLNFYSKARSYAVLTSSSWLHSNHRGSLLKAIPSFKYNMYRTGASLWTIKV